MTIIIGEKNKLVCPKCGGDLTSTKDSRPHMIDGARLVRRSRICGSCNKRSNTLELTEASFEKLISDLRTVKLDADVKVQTAMAALKIFAEASKS